MVKPKLFAPIQYDHWILSLALTILAIGLLLLASASMSISDHIFHQPFYFLLRQIIFLIVSIVSSLVVIRVPLIFWEKIGFYLLFTSFLLLMLVLVPGIGREVNGSMRWLGIGPFTLQVSELAKFSLIIFMAGFLTRRQDEVQNSTLGILKPLILLMFICGLLLLEPDFGAAVVITFTVLGMLFLANARIWQFLVLLLLVGCALALLAVSSPYRMARLTSFLNPWAQPFDSGYQLTQSLIAFGRGGIFGSGLGNSIQKLFYLPEAHTDFLFAVLAEELGVVGQVVVLSFFSLLVGRILYLGRQLSLNIFQAQGLGIKSPGGNSQGKEARNLGISEARGLSPRAEPKQLYNANVFAMYLSYGFGLLLGVQVIINVGVNVGLLPTKGLTLPLMSYGGSSMLFSCLVIAILLRIYHESTYCLKKTKIQNGI